MAGKHETYHHLFDRYFKGELQGQELDKFMIQLKTDPEFAKQFKYFEAIVSGIKESRKAVLKEKLAAIPSKQLKTIPIKTWLLPAAALVVLGLTWAIVSWIKQSPSEQHTLAKEELPLEPRIIDTAKIRKPAANDPADSSEITIADAISQPSEVPEPEMDVVEDENREFEKEEIKDADIASVEQPEIEGNDDENVVVKSDSLMASTTSFVFQYVQPTKSTSKQVSSSETVSEKRRRKGNLNDSSEKAPESDPPETDQPESAGKTAGSSSLKVQYWKSVVNFTGYEFSGSTLKLFGLNQSPALIHQMGNLIILQKGSSYYPISKDGQPHPLPKPIAKPSFIP